MLPGQLESDFAMVEIVSIGINPIVASQAVLTVSLEVGLHILNIDLLMAGSADGLIKLCVAANVASTAHKRRTIRLVLVGSQGITESIV
jgi:hypothetical protein